MGTMGLRGDPVEIREHYRKGPFRIRIEEWKDRKGCNVTLFADEWEEATAKGTPQRMYHNLLLCTECRARTGVLSLGPKNYYWRIQTRHGVLWALNRQHLAEIRDYIESTSRPQGFHKIPAIMLKGSNREEMVRLINRAFERGPDTR